MLASARAPRPAQTPLTLVVGFDFTIQAEVALDQAIELTRGRGAAVVHAVAVVAGDWPASAPADATDPSSPQHAILRTVEGAIAREGGPGLRVFIHQRYGDPAREIVALAAEVDAEIIVVGTHGRHGLDRLIAGSVAEQVLRHARCTVVVARPTTYDPSEKPEAPCPACVSRRRETGGAEWSCGAHAQRWVAPHRYAYTDEGINRMRPDEWPLW